MDDRKPIVYYDGACPICRREINYYRSRPGAENMEWRDVSHCADDAVDPDLRREDALARFHARGPDGSLVDGAAAFGLMWSNIAGFRTLGWIAQKPGIRHVLDVCYTFFLRVRPHAQRLFR